MHRTFQRTSHGVGALRTALPGLDLADLDWEKELELVCPTDLTTRYDLANGRHGA
jgi:hypothetical protein